MKKNLLVLIIIGIFICITLLLLLPSHPNLFIQSRSSNIQSTQIPHPTENCTQFPLAEGCNNAHATINVCLQQYTGFPPIKEILTNVSKPNLGIFDGKITQINKLLFTVTVSSLTNKLTYVFSNGTINGKIYDVHNAPLKSVLMLKPGTDLLVTFPCLQHYGFFTITRAQLVK